MEDRGVISHIEAIVSLAGLPKQAYKYSKALCIYVYSSIYDP